MPIFKSVIQEPPRSEAGGSASRPRSRSRSRSPARSRSRTRRRRRQRSPGRSCPPPPAKILKPMRKAPQSPQAAIDEFWAKFTTKVPGKATSVLPSNQLATNLAGRYIRATSVVPPSDDQGDGNPAAPPAASMVAHALPVYASYEAAAAVCRAKVQKIINECRRVNKKYRDAHFDIETDLKMGARNCLQSLSNMKRKGEPPGRWLRPRGVKRVTDIFDEPKFYIDGPTSNDVRQGRDGDCWLLSALCTISNKKGMIERLCVAHDPDVGVYGFVFHRDGEWISEIVDDFLYLTKSDYDEGFIDRVLFDELERVNQEELYREVYQSNSGALYFAQCAHLQETWLPLLEKGYAKAHGDFAAIEGGFGGEGIEDLTGGVTSEIFTSDILDKELFWEELLSANKEFLFSCCTGLWGAKSVGRMGIVEQHSYSVQKAIEVDGKRLVRLKNPWGKAGWKGPWSDGSKEWTPEWLQKLDHQFGDHGDFWIEYSDLLRKYQSFERTRLFEGDWNVAQSWTTLNVPWIVAYHDTYFSFTISKPGRVVIVLTQLDDRYFRGLEGQYSFQLCFRVHIAGQEDYVIRSQLHQRLRRSVSVELDLEANTYDVRVKVDTYRDHDILSTEEVIRRNATDNRDKLTRIGLAYNSAHGKGLVVETAEERAAKVGREKDIEEAEKQKIGRQLQSNKKQDDYMRLRDLDRQRGRELKMRAKERPKFARNPEGPRMPPRMPPVPHMSIATASNSAEARFEAHVEHDAQADEAIDFPGNRQEECHGNYGGNEQGQDLEEGEPYQVSVKRQNSGEHSFASYESQCNDDELDSLDGVSVYSARELDIRATVILEQMCEQAQKGREIQPGQKQEANQVENGFENEPENDPWNAAAVVGLRVYHQCAEGSAQNDEKVVSVRVVRPNPYAGDEIAAEPQGTESQANALDVDDSAMDVTYVDPLTQPGAGSTTA